MKKSNLLLEKLKSNKFDLLAGYILVFTINLMIYSLFLGCVAKMEKVENTASTVEVTSNNDSTTLQQSILDSMPFIPKPQKLLFQGPGALQAVVVGELSPDSCETGNEESETQAAGNSIDNPPGITQSLSIALKLQSPFLKEDFLLKLSKSNSGSKLILEQGERGFTFNADNEKINALIANLCQMADSEDEKIALDDGIIKKISDLLLLATKDCQDITVTSDGLWKCQLKAHSRFQISEAIIADKQKSLLRKYQRLPYVFARKIAFSLMFVKATKTAADKKSFCNLLNRAKDDEAVVPAALATKGFYISFCTDEAHKLSENELNYVFSLVMTEAELLSKLMEEGTKTGLINIEFKERSGHRDDYVVEIKPLEAVEKILAAKLDSYALTQANTSGKTGCWHPLVSFQGNDYQNFLRYRLISPNPQSCTIQGPESPATLALSQSKDLFLTSITASELEFKLTYGRSKLIRLPIGEYEFKINRDTLTPLAKPESVLAGRFEWSHKNRQRTTLRNININ